MGGWCYWEGELMRAIYTTITNSDFYDVIREDAAEGETNWTIKWDFREIKEKWLGRNRYPLVAGALND
jgi:hypothetical protein